MTELYVRDGSRFVRACAGAYAALDALAADAPAAVPTAENPIVEVAPGNWRLHTPKCPHGYFLRYALGVDPKTGKPNCPRCHRNPPG